MRKLDEILLVALVSAAVGIIVALPFILLTEKAILAPIVKAAAAGMAIGLIARHITIYIFLNINQHPVYTFAAIFIIILIGTGGAAILFNTQNKAFIAGMVILAEIIGMSVSLVLHRYISKLNDQLEKTQEKFMTVSLRDKT